MSNFKVEFKNIKKIYPGVRALDNVSFGIKEGQIHGLVGENGAGKSTLVNILVGATNIDSGEIFIDGVLTQIKNPADSIKYGIATIFQELNIIPELAIKYNIFLGREIRNRFGILDDKAMEKQTQEMINKLGLDLKANILAKDLSTAQCKMIEIARAVFHDFKILIMDEPTASISELEVKKLFSIINGLRNEGVTIIYISHKLEEISRICNSVTVLRDGKHILTKDISQISREEMIINMINRDISEEYPKRKSVPLPQKILEVQNLTSGNLVKNISFEIKKGEILGIAGLIGSGKTELAKTIFGALRRDKGRIFFNGKEINKINPIKSIKIGIAYVPEDRKREGLVLSLPVFVNIIIIALKKISKLFILNEKLIKKMVNTYFNLLKIAATSGKQITRTLSGGNQQKIVIAKWLAIKPDLLIFDEPTIGIDVGTKYEIRKIINDLADNGKSIIIISSEIEEVSNLADRVIVLRSGEKVADIPKGINFKERIYGYATGISK